MGRSSQLIEFQLVLRSQLSFRNMEGSYTYTSSEGYDEFLGIRGVPWIVRKMILAAPVELKVLPGEKWTMAYKSPIKTNSYEFKPGVPFEQLGPTGKMEGNLVTVEGSESLVMRNDTSNVDEAGEMKRTLSFSPEGITETLYTVKQDVTCKRYYTRNGR